MQSENTIDPLRAYANMNPREQAYAEIAALMSAYKLGVGWDYQRHLVCLAEQYDSDEPQFGPMIPYDSLSDGNAIAEQLCATWCLDHGITPETLRAVGWDEGNLLWLQPEEKER